MKYTLILLIAIFIILIGVKIKDNHNQKIEKEKVQQVIQTLIQMNSQKN